jgi:hypothetical protein
MKLAVAVVDVAVAEKMDAAAVRNSRSRARGVHATTVALILAFMVLPAFMAPPASALEGIDLSKEAAPAAAGECPALIQIKYPFLSCKSGQIGLASGNATWENSRQIPRQGDFNEGNGYWGDELNRD